MMRPHPPAFSTFLVSALYLCGSILPRDGGTEIAVRVTPRGGRNALDGVTEDGTVRVRLAAPPVEGPRMLPSLPFLRNCSACPNAP